MKASNEEMADQYARSHGNAPPRKADDGNGSTKQD